MNIAVMGAGAVGCYYGGMLARGGHDVVLIARPQHVEAIVRDGLRLQTRSFDEHIRVSASTEASAVEGADVVLFCVKSIDTESAAAGLGKYLGSDALVLTLQNGVENADLLRTLIQQEVAASVVYVAAEMAGPGHVLHHGRGDLIIEPSRKSEEIARVFSAAGVPTEISDNVRGALWAKLILNCAYNALSAIAHVTYGELVQSDGVPRIMEDVVDECLAVAKADGVSIPGDPHEAVRRLAASMPAQYSSTAQDLSRGKRTEIDHLNGLVVRRGEALGVPTPVNRVLHTLVKLIEGKQAGAL